MERRGEIRVRWGEVPSLVAIEEKKAGSGSGSGSGRVTRSSGRAASAPADTAAAAEDMSFGDEGTQTAPHQPGKRKSSSSSSGSRRSRSGTPKAGIHKVVKRRKRRDRKAKSASPRF